MIQEMKSLSIFFLLDVPVILFELALPTPPRLHIVTCLLRLGSGWLDRILPSWRKPRDKNFCCAL